MGAPSNGSDVFLLQDYRGKKNKFRRLKSICISTALATPWSVWECGLVRLAHMGQMGQDAPTRAWSLIACRPADAGVQHGTFEGRSGYPQMQEHNQCGLNKNKLICSNTRYTCTHPSIILHTSFKQEVRKEKHLLACPAAEPRLKPRTTSALPSTAREAL